MTKLVAPRVPSPPIASQWTKLTPALNAILIGVLLRCWVPIWAHAFGELSYATNDDDVGGDADDKCGDLDFQALNGRRYRRSSAFVADRPSQINLIVLAI